MSATFDIYDPGRARIRESLRQVFIDTMKPAPRMLPSVWAEANIVLSKRISAGNPGRLKLTGYQRYFLDLCADPTVDEVYWMKSARTGANLMLAVLEMFIVENDPGPVLHIEPTENMGENYVRTYIEPLLRDSPAISRVYDHKGSSIKRKSFLNDSVIISEPAASWNTFRFHTGRLIACDELDDPNWDSGADEEKSEGDKLTLAKTRGQTVPGSKLVGTSTPTISGISRIEKGYLRGDQRKWFVPCPHCGEFQVLEWGDRNERWGLEWPDGRPDLAYYVCRHNGCIIEHREKAAMVAAGEGRATAVGEPGVASFHVNALYSPDAKASWGKLATEFVQASREAASGKKGRLQAFINTKMGETWSLEEAEKLGAHELSALCEPYQADVPADVVALYSGMDFQEGKRGSGGYAEAKVIGIGPAGERLSEIGHWVLDEVPMSDPGWNDYIQHFLNREFRGADGRVHRIHAAALDTGYNQEKILSFCRSYDGDVKLFPVKGSSARTGKAWPRMASDAKDHRGQFFTICVNSIKDLLMDKLSMPAGAPGSVRFPTKAIPGASDIDGAYFERMTRETRRMKPGSTVWTWTRKRDNEPWVCLVYAYAASLGVRAMRGGQLLDALFQGSVAMPAPTEPDPPPPPPPADIPGRIGLTIHGAEPDPNPRGRITGNEPKPEPRNPLQALAEEIQKRSAPSVPSQGSIDRGRVGAAPRRSSWLNR